jgi:hypothetical protein
MKRILNDFGPLILIALSFVLGFLCGFYGDKKFEFAFFSNTVLVALGSFFFAKEHDIAPFNFVIGGIIGSILFGLFGNTSGQFFWHFTLKQNTVQEIIRETVKIVSTENLDPAKKLFVLPQYITANKPFIILSNSGTEKQPSTFKPVVNIFMSTSIPYEHRVSFNRLPGTVVLVSEWPPSKDSSPKQDIRIIDWPSKTTTISFKSSSFDTVAELLIYSHTLNKNKQP